MLAIILVGELFLFSQKERVIEMTYSQGSNNQALAFSATNEDLLTQINSGRDLLRRSAPLGFTEITVSKKVYLTKNKTKLVPEQQLVNQEVALAILDTNSGSIVERRYWLDEEQIKDANFIRRTYLENFENIPNFRPATGSEDFKVTVKWWNYFNSDLHVNLANDNANSKRYIVIAMKYGIPNDDLAYPEDRTGKKYSDIVYTPYSNLIHRPELVSAGKQFLEERVTKAFARLTSLKIKSHAFPDQLVVNTITPQFIKNIFLTEQTDPKLIMLAGDGGQKLVERVMVRLATNGETAFRYTYSKTGALGLGQIMPGTYDSIVKRYPNAKLIKDTGIGRVNIDNAIIASILVFDDHLQSVKDRVANAKSTQGNKYWQAIVSNTSKLEEVRAAIYNGGPGKYKVLTGTISIAVNETVDFVRKFKLIRELKLFQIWRNSLLMLLFTSQSCSRVGRKEFSSMSEYSCPNCGQEIDEIGNCPTGCEVELFEGENIMGGETIVSTLW